MLYRNISFLLLWLYKISFMSAVVWHFLPIVASHCRKTSFICAFCLGTQVAIFSSLVLGPPRLPATGPFADPPQTNWSQVFGASLSNYLYGIHNFCWWSFAQAACCWLTMAAWSACTSVYGIEYLVPGLTQPWRLCSGRWQLRVVVSRIDCLLVLQVALS